MIHQEIKNYLRFVNGLVSSLLKTGKAVFQTGNETFCIKIDNNNKMSPNESFMESVINSQKKIIANLITQLKETSIMVCTIQKMSKKL